MGHLMCFDRMGYSKERLMEEQMEIECRSSAFVCFIDEQYQPQKNSGNEMSNDKRSVQL